MPRPYARFGKHPAIAIIFRFSPAESKTRDRGRDAPSRIAGDLGPRLRVDYHATVFEDTERISLPGSARPTLISEGRSQALRTMISSMRPGRVLNGFQPDRSETLLIRGVSCNRVVMRRDEAGGVARATFDGPSRSMCGLEFRPRRKQRHDHGLEARASRPDRQRAGAC